MVQGTSTVVISGRQGFSTRGSLSKLLKLAGAELKPAEVQDILRPALNKVYENIRKRYRTLLQHSSLWLGAYKQPLNNTGSLQEGHLYNGLQQDPMTVSKSADKLTLEWGISFANPPKDKYYFERADRGWVNADKPNLGAIFRWANAKYGWGLDHLKNKKRMLFTALRKYRVPFGGTSTRADRALYVIWRRMASRRYKGIRLRKHLTLFTKEAMAVASERGKLLTAKTFAHILARQKGLAP